MLFSFVFLPLFSSHFQQVACSLKPPLPPPPGGEFLFVCKSSGASRRIQRACALQTAPSCKNNSPGSCDGPISGRGCALLFLEGEEIARRLSRPSIKRTQKAAAVQGEAARWRNGHRGPGIRVSPLLCLHVLLTQCRPGPPTLVPPPPNLEACGRVKWCVQARVFPPWVFPC